jgi:hypothetical protein
MPVQKECSIIHPTGYGPCSTETIMLMLGLMAVSWFKLNIKKKIEKGHCHNPAHEPVKTLNQQIVLSAAGFMETYMMTIRQF